MVRVKQRYILIELQCCEKSHNNEFELPFNGKDLLYAIRDTIEMIHGDYGVGVAGSSTTVQYYNPITRLAILRCLRDHHKIITSSLPILKSVQQVSISIRSLHISGTVRSCQKFIIKYNRRQLISLASKSNVSEKLISSYKEIPMAAVQT